MDLSEYKKIVGKGSARARTTSPPQKKVQSGKEQMDLSEAPSEIALDCVQIIKSQYVEYGNDFIVFKAPDGGMYRLTIKPEK